MSPCAQYWFAGLMLVISGASLFGIRAAFKQVKAAQKALKAQVLMKLCDEWRGLRIYYAMRYVSDLRAKWKDRPLEEWPTLAEEWVIEHAGKRADSPDPAEKRLGEEWYKRRTASQFLAKMGLLIEQGYLSEDEFFGVDPEVGRQLAVLIPIEKAVQEYWMQRETNPIAAWDKPFPKWEFNQLWTKYELWYHRHGEGKLILNAPNWSPEHEMEHSAS
jgi:hypothetical protein